LVTQKYISVVESTESFSSGIQTHGST